MPPSKIFQEFEDNFTESFFFAEVLKYLQVSLWDSRLDHCFEICLSSTDILHLMIPTIFHWMNGYLTQKACFTLSDSIECPELSGQLAHPFRAPPSLGTYDTNRPVFLHADRPIDLVHLASYVTGNAARVLAVVLLAVILLARWL